MQRLRKWRRYKRPLTLGVVSALHRQAPPPFSRVTQLDGVTLPNPIRRGDRVTQLDRLLRCTGRHTVQSCRTPFEGEIVAEWGYATESPAALHWPSHGTRLPNPISNWMGLRNWIRGGATGEVRGTRLPNPIGRGDRGLRVRILEKPERNDGRCAKVDWCNSIRQDSSLFSISRLHLWRLLHVQGRRMLSKSIEIAFVFKWKK